MESIFLVENKQSFIHKIRIIFNSGVVDPIEIFVMAQVKGWAWVTYKFPKSNFSYSDWCFDVYECLKSLH